jgi:hypothetical protein
MVPPCPLPRPFVRGSAAAGAFDGVPRLFLSRCAEGQPAEVSCYL